jgi:hypothetical protein
MAMAKRNDFNKAVQSAMAKAKKHNPRALLEWLIACNTNAERGLVFDQWKLLELYGRDSYDGESGATKICHLRAHDGQKFQYIVIKRFKEYGHDFAQGNQLILEIKCWEALHNTADADFLCPILKYFTSKSDKVTESSETMKRNVLIIAQKAVYVSNAQMACEKAEALNRENGYRGESAGSRYAKLKDFANRQNWWDAIGNRGNSGVVFDYSKNCYKAVFIDYAL